MTKEPKFIALLDECLDLTMEYGAGDTADEAFDDLLQSGGLEDHCAYWTIKKGSDVEVYIYSTRPVNRKENPEWIWEAGTKIETRIAEAI